MDDGFPVRLIFLNDLLALLHEEVDHGLGLLARTNARIRSHRGSEKVPDFQSRFHELDGPDFMGQRVLTVDLNAARGLPGRNAVKALER